MPTGTNNDDNDDDNDDYCSNKLDPCIVEKLEAGAFRELCRHLQERSDSVQNMDLMTLSGFCRNCLAKVGHSYICTPPYCTVCTAKFALDLLLIIEIFFTVDGVGSSSHGGQAKQRRCYSY
jgi:Protein of unknown function (DUF1244)